jgi:alkanesulfonate monooxygenase
MSRRPEPRFDWFIPIDGDGAHIGMRRAERPPTFEYLRRVVETAEAEGYYSLLIPTRFANGLFEETAPLAETWTTVTALAAVTRRIRFLVAVRPGFISTGLFAQMAAALDQISGGRLDLNVVPGGIQGDFERLGVTMDHDKRYEQAEEFIAALRALWAKPEPVVFEGSTIRLKGAVVSPGPVGDAPRFCVGGASPRALQFTAREADALPGVDPAGGRHPRLLEQVDERVVAQRQTAFAGTQMVGQQAQLRAHVQERAPRLWNGISRVRVNLGTAIVGDPAQVNVASAVLPGLREAIRRES